ncbi:MarR family transcriptional regulator [Arcobacteraceae bacterium]|nr:MarR family transcriptional regulator [Arcobacteraceae bacterium]
MDTELQKSLGFKINQIANKINSNLLKVLHPFNIAPEQRATLEIIKYEQEVNQTKISNILGKDKTTISRTLNTLEKKGYISKKAIDKRTNSIELTDEGEIILSSSKADVLAFRNKLSSLLTMQEQKQFIETLAKISLYIENEK